MKVICLVDDYNNDLFYSEHGLSFYIEVDGLKILYDMGQSDKFILNASKKNIYLEDIDYAVLSHGHYDHGGGINFFLNINKKAKIFVSEYAFNDFYNLNNKYIGIDKNLMFNERIILLTKDYLISDNVIIKSANNVIDKFKVFPLLLLKNNDYINDNFLHEQYLLIKENDKNILFSSCSHKGILNILNSFNVNVFFGGFHFKDLDCINDINILNEYAYELNRFNCVFYTNHCTGFNQYLELKKIIKNNLNYMYCGDEIIIK